MKISLGRLLLVFSVGISALPMLAMAALILMMNSDIRTIAESEFDKISLQSARRLAEDTVRICAIIQNSREAANDNARKILLAQLSQFGHAKLSYDAETEVSVSAQGDNSQRRLVKIPTLAFGDEKVQLRLDPKKRIVGADGAVAKILDTLKADTGLEYALLLRINDAGDMLRVATTVKDADGNFFVGNSIPAAGDDASAAVRNLLSKRPFSGTVHSGTLDFVGTYEPLIGSNGNVIGAVCYGSLQKSYEFVLKYFESMRLGTNGFVWAIERLGDGRAVWRVSKDGKLNSMIVDTDGVDDRREAMLGIVADAVSGADGKIGVRQYHISELGRHGDVTSVYTYFKPWNMVVGVTAYKSDFAEAMMRIGRSGERFIFLLFPLGILMLGFAAFTARIASIRGTEMTGGLVEAANMIRDGNLRGARDVLSDLTDPSKPGNSEIFALCVALKKMTGYLSKLVWKVQSGGVNLASGAVKISDGAAEIDAISTQKAQSLRKVANATDSISSSVERLKSKAARAAADIGASVGGMETGGEYLKRLTENAAGLLSATESVASRLSIIQEKTDGISSAITTVNTVSQRTNLLSLNASIEAEKAGEFGGGFAIVAGEIGRLADQTAVSAMNISKMASDMRDSVESGVVEMRSFVILMRRSLRVIDKVADNMKAVAEQVAALGPKFDELAGGVDTQSTRAARISETMRELSESATRTGDKIAAFKSATDSLEKTAEELRTKVSQFKLPKLDTPRNKS